jgi:hypothetical protein
MMCHLKWKMVCLPTLLFATGFSALFAQNAPVAPASDPQHKTAEMAGLSGQVTNQSGSPIANARVVLQNLATSDQKSTLSAADGGFSTAGMPPGEYQLHISAEGYKTFTVLRIPLVSGDEAKAIAIMQPGSMSEEVLGSEASVVSRLGTALAGKRVTDLPENQRNFVNLVQVAGGANEGSMNTSGTAIRPGAQHQSSAVSVGGQPEQTNNSMIDGIDNNERINSQIAVHPSMDAVQEVQVFASAYPANLGHAGGGVINVVSKAGANKYHGSLYEYFGNDVLGASPFQFGGKNRKPEIRQNQFGGSVGGPIGRHKTYFYGDYEGFRLIQARAPLELTVPTAYEHNHPGDFTDVGGPVVSRLDPIGLAYFELYPLPNVSGSSNQFVSAANGSNFSNVSDLRIDQKLSENDLLFGRYSYNRTLVSISGQFPQVQEDGRTIQPGGFLYSFPGNMIDSASNLALSYSHTFHSHLVAEFLVGYTHWSEADTGLNPNVAVNAGFGQPGINVPGTSDGLAPVNVLQASPLGNDGYYRPTDQGDSIYQYGGSLGWNHSKHDFRGGFSLIRRNWNDIGSSFGLGTWEVQDLPSLLSGQFLQTQREVDLDHPHYESWEPSAYLQDEWKVLQNLTLNFGLRYDIFTPPTESQNRMSNFDLSTGQIIVAGQNGVSKTADVRTDHATLAPRLGLNWQIKPHTMVAGGFGIVYFRPIDTFYYKAPPFNYSFGICSSLTCPGGFTSLAAGLPFVNNPSTTNPSGFLLGMRAPGFPESYMEQFNLGIEQHAGHNTIRLFNVGAMGRHIARTFPDINAPPPNTSARPDLLRPYYSTVPNVTSIGFVDTGASSFYDALQASGAHAYDNGLTAQLNYTWAHGTDNVGGGQSGFGTVPDISSKLDHGNSVYDVRHRAAATLFYELPFGKGANGARAMVIKSWQLNFSGVWSTGLPFTVVNATDVSNTNPGAYAADRPNQIGNADVRTPGVSRFFNTGEFVSQAPGTLGDERSNQLYGPHNRRLDTSVFKDFAVRNELKIQFRAEIFNVTNTANFASPASVLGGANFGQLTQSTAGYTPREVQLALRFQF